MDAKNLLDGKRARMIRAPGARLLKTIGLGFVRPPGKGKSVYAELNLTSMVDMLTILVVFLLQMFSATGQLNTPGGLKLPTAINFRELELAPVVSVTHDTVTLDGRIVATLDDVERLRADAKLIDLHDQLLTLKHNYQLLHPGQRQPNSVILQADATVDFRVLKKVMHSCALAGYGDVSFAVTPRAG